MTEHFILTTVESNSSFVTVFAEQKHDSSIIGGMLLTDRISAINFRLRESKPGYQADWHVAGDPTLIIVQHGTIRISLQNGDYKDFSAGDMFIAKDFVPKQIPFDNTVHGHRAEVIGEQPLRAVHIKLESLGDS